MPPVVVFSSIMDWFVAAEAADAERFIEKSLDGAGRVCGVKSFMSFVGVVVIVLVFTVLEAFRVFEVRLFEPELKLPTESRKWPMPRVENIPEMPEKRVFKPACGSSIEMNASIIPL